MSPSPLPFAHLNLRRNPFGQLARADWGDLAEAELDDLVPRLMEPRFAVQFLGRAGRGKTTHLLALARRLPTAGYVYFGPAGRPALPPGRPLLVDEMQRMACWRRWWLYARGVPLALATHEDLAGELRRAGYAVQTRRLDGRLDAGRLERLLNRRIDWFRRGPGAVPRIAGPAAERLLARFGDDLRAIESYLYERFQHLEDMGDVEV